VPLPQKRVSRKSEFMVRLDVGSPLPCAIFSNAAPSSLNGKSCGRSEVAEVAGHTVLRQITISNTRTGERESVDARHLFVCIGGNPHTEWARNTNIIRDRNGYLITGPDLYERGAPPKVWPLKRPPFYLETSVPGSFAAGDVRHGSVKRFASAVGEGAMAVTFVPRYLTEKFGRSI
jgi:thioredoxin reductase (NADPH)